MDIVKRMTVSVFTLLLIYVLIVLVICVLLFIPNFGFHHQKLVAVFFALIVGAIVITLVPVTIENEAEQGTYNMILIIIYLLPIILIIVIASTVDYYRHNKSEDNNFSKGELSCDETGENCYISETES